MTTGGKRRMFNPVTPVVAGMIIVLSILAGIWIGYMNNNEQTVLPSPAALSFSRDRAIGWLRAHEAEALDAENPALWWMIKESATVSKDPYLTSLYGRYYDRYLANRPGNVWHHLCDPDSRVMIDTSALDGWPDYSVLFLYGLSCQSRVRSDPRALRLLDADACPGFGSFGYFRDPACLSHQLMGLRFEQQHHCEDPGPIDRSAAIVTEKVATAARWDFRVVDAYIQKLMMLVESGATDRVAPQWVHRVLLAQRPDGGWDDFQALVGPVGNRHLGWSGRGLRFAEPMSNFHTTAQGIYLMTMLSSNAGDAPTQRLPPAPN
jgi:hypothetical protein